MKSSSSPLLPLGAIIGIAVGGCCCILICLAIVAAVCFALLGGRSQEADDGEEAMVVPAQSGVAGNPLFTPQEQKSYNPIFYADGSGRVAAPGSGQYTTGPGTANNMFAGSGAPDMMSAREQPSPGYQAGGCASRLAVCLLRRSPRRRRLGHNERGGRLCRRRGQHVSDLQSGLSLGRRLGPPRQAAARRRRRARHRVSERCVASARRRLPHARSAAAAGTYPSAAASYPSQVTAPLSAGYSPQSGYPSLQPTATGYISGVSPTCNEPRLVRRR